MSKDKTSLIPIPLGIASVWFATHAGPGAASGKFSAVYFSVFGRWGLISPAISMLLISICIYVAIEYSRRKKIRNFNEFTNSFFHPYGKIFSFIFDTTYLFGVLIALAAGIATASGVVSVFFHIPYWLAASGIVGLSILLASFNGKLVRSASTFMTLIIVLCLGAIVITGLTSPMGAFKENWASSSFSDFSFLDAMVKAFVYAGVITTGCVANSIAVSDVLQSQRQSKQAAALGFLMNFFLAGSVTFLLFAYPDYIGSDIPNYYIAEKLGQPILLFAYVIMLVMAVISTNVSYAFSTVTRYSSYLPIRPGKFRDFLTICILFLVSFGISFLGLDLIINRGYTYLGYIAIPTVILPLILLGKRKIKEI